MYSANLSRRADVPKFKVKDIVCVYINATLKQLFDDSDNNITNYNNNNSEQQVSVSPQHT